MQRSFWEMFDLPEYFYIERIIAPVTVPLFHTFWHLRVRQFKHTFLKLQFRIHYKMSIKMKLKSLPLSYFLIQEIKINYWITRDSMLNRDTFTQRYLHMWSILNITFLKKWSLSYSKLTLQTNIGIHVTYEHLQR